MLLSMSMIAHKLKHFRTQISLRDCEKPTIKTIKFVKKDQGPYDEESLYVVDANEFNSLPSTNVRCNIIVNGSNTRIQALRHKQCCNLIIIDEKCDTVKLFNEIQDIFTHYRDWADEIQDALVKDKGLQYIIDSSYSIFENPIYLIDSSFRTLAYSKDVGPDEIDTLWKSIVEEGHTDIATVNAMKESGVLNWLNSNWEPIINESPIFSHPRINANIMNGSSKAGTLIIIGAFNVLETAHLHLAAYLTRIIFLALQRDHIYQNTRGEIYNYFFADLLEGKDLKKKFIGYQLQFLDWSVQDHYFVVEVKVEKADLTNNTLDYIAHQLESICGECRSIIYYENIVLIINTRNKTTLEQEYSCRLEQFLENSNLTAGLSSCCPDIFAIRDYYLQASASNLLGPMVNKKTPLFKYESLSLYHIIHLASDKIELTRLCHPALKFLNEYDRDNKSDFYKTLQVFILNDRNLVKSAELLYIHRNTLVYRINRIIDLTGINLNSNDEKKQLLLSYDIHNYLAHLSG